MKTKKSIAKLVLLTFLLSLVLPTGAAMADTTTAPGLAPGTTFSDLPSGPSGEVLQRAIHNGLLKGYNGQVMPNAPLTRNQMSSIIVRAFGATGVGDLSAFTDVSDKTRYNELSAAYKMGVIKGYGDKMSPEQNITRQEALVIVSRAFQLAPAATMNRTFADSDTIADWARGSINAMVNAGYVNGDGTNLHLNNTMTRMEFATIFDHILKNYITTPGEVTKVADGNVMVNVSGVTLKDCTVKGDLIVGDGVGNGDLTLDNVTVTGRTVVRGGGAHSVVIKGGSNLNDLIISKHADGSLRIVTEDGSIVPFTTLDDGKDGVILEGVFGNVTVTDNTPVTLQNATVNILSVTAKDATINVDQGSQVTTVATDQPGTTVNIAGTVTNVNASSAAAGLQVNVAADGTATNVTTAAPDSTISNDGKVGTLSITQDASGAKMVVGKDATLGKVVSAQQGNLTVTTAAAEQAAINQAAANQALAAATTDAQKAAALAAVAAANQAAADAKSEAEKVTTDVNNKTEIRPVDAPVIETVTINTPTTTPVTPGTKPETPAGGTGTGGTTTTEPPVVEDDSRPSTSISVTTAEALTAALANAQYRTINVSGTIEVTTDLTVLKGVTLGIASGTTLTIGANGSITNNGTIINNGTIVVNDEAGLRLAVAIGGTVRLEADITGLTSPLEVHKEVTIDGNSKTLTFTGLENVTTTSDDGLIISAKATVNNLTVDAGLSTPGTWYGTYAIHVYNTTDVTLNNVTVTKGNGGILVNGSTVTLTGNTNVSDNGFGGIEVGQGTGVTNTAALTISGTIVNNSEAVGLPTIWIAKVGGTAQGTLTGDSAFTGIVVTKTNNDVQTQYYLDAKNATAPTP